MNHSNATMATSSFDRISGGNGSSASGPSLSQRYNSFRVQTQGGNIIQGQINKIRVAEVLFPYCIPTINNQLVANSSTGTDRSNGGLGNGLLYFQAYSVTSNGTTAVAAGPLGGVQTISIPTGFYTGTELAAVVQAALAAIETAQGIPAGTFTFTYDTTSNAFVIENTDVFNADVGAANYFGQLVWAGSTQSPASLSQPDALWTLGFRQIFADNPALPASAFVNRLSSSSNTWMLVPAGYPNTAAVGAVTGYPVFPVGYGPTAVHTSQYTGLYTQWIDICSPTLCQAQYVRDGNTNQKTVNRDLICRLYIANEVSLFQTDPTGTRPFVIHRQFKNAKIMKWTAERSIDSIDIQLYDMFGNPLPVVNPYLTVNDADLAGPQILQGQPSDFAITFLVDEQDDPVVSNSENIGYRY
jgi:hypothetical protein